MVFGLKKLFKSGARAPADLPEDVQAALQAWRSLKAPALDEPHFHTRYVVLDIATTGPRASEDDLTGLCAVALSGGTVRPADAFAFDFASEEETEDVAVDRQLAAFLTYTAKAPLVTYHSPFVTGFLQRTIKERLGVDFQPQWIDLAWLLPSMFNERSVGVLPLDDWLDRFALGGGGRRDTMDNTLMLARLFHMLLVRANAKEVINGSKLIDESQAATFLRRTH